jgi:hypothetical protein
MSQDQIVRRSLIRIAGKSDRIRYCGDLLIPVLDCKKNQCDTCHLKHRESAIGLDMDEEEIAALAKTPEEFIAKAPAKYKPCAHCAEFHPKLYQGAAWYKKAHVNNPLTWREALKLGRQFSNRLKGREFKLDTHPNSSISVKGIEARLDAWEHFDGFVPDVIIIDYADILAAEDGRIEFRHQENEKWKALRALSQKRHCLVIVATQANAQSYDASVLKMKHVSEDKRKYAHVTGMIGLNQSEEEKTQGIMRLNWLVLRESDFEISKTVKVLQCLKVGRPHLGSFY